MIAFSFEFAALIGSWAYVDHEGRGARARWQAECEFYRETHEARVHRLQKRARLSRPFPQPQSIRPLSRSTCGQSMRRRILPPNPRDGREGGRVLGSFQNI